MSRPRKDADLNEQIALPRTGKFNFFAAGRRGGIVIVWSFAERKKISEFETTLDFGGPRLAMGPSANPLVATGSWRRGITAYAARHGGLLWSRPDLKCIQQACDLSDDKQPLIGVGLEAGSYYILRADTGENYSKLAGITSIYASPLDPH